MTPLRIAIVSLAVLALAGCASTDERSSQFAPQGASSVFDTDEEYVANVESIARRRHMDVVWVNPPKKRIPQDD
jgi:hypothetical protein